MWRESEEGQEIILEFDDGRYEDLFLRFLSGRFDDSPRDPLLFLYKTMNLAELSASRNLDNLSDTDGSGDEEDSDDQVLLESAEEQAAKQAAEAELKKLGSDELLGQAAETAARVAKQARDAQVSDEQIYFNTAQGRLEMSEGSCGAEPRVNPRGSFPNDGESAAPSDIAHLLVLGDKNNPPPDAPRFTGQVRAFDDTSDIGAPTEFGALADERPPQGMTELPPRPPVKTEQTDIQPEFIPELLEEGGSSVFKPDLGTNGLPYKSWKSCPPAGLGDKRWGEPLYFFSAPGNYEEL